MTPVLGRKVALEAATQVPDGAGGSTESWGVLGTLWAEIRPRTGRETTGEGGAVSLTGFRITVRAAPAGSDKRPAAGQRFREGGRVYRIVSVTEKDRAGLYLTCIATEEVAA